MTARGVQIAGTGCLCACGLTAEDCFEGALSGRARFALPAGRVESAYAASYPVFMLPEEVLQKCPPRQSVSLFFFLQSAREAFLQAGVSPQELASKRVGVIVGTSVDASFHCFNVYKNWRAGHTADGDAERLAHYFSSSTAQAVSRRFGFTGPFQTVVTACASGTDAVGLAKSWIDSGLCDAVLCGGADEINLIPYDGFIRLLIASKERCRPFSKDRAGINIGEGAAALLLVSDALAREFSLTPKGYVLGYGNACDAFHPTAPDPEAKGLKKAISFALSEAGLSAGDLAFVNAHGTASQANDAAEAAAFNALLSGVPVWGSKGVTGHTLGAAGAVEAVLCLQALNRRILPPTFGFTRADETLGFAPVTQASEITKRAALSDSLAFGGCNAAVVLGAEDYYG
ncbi:beta-ketoacyl-[acyl-carrier-protein] synthase family protein [Candidatus Avelusimicrobium alvi]|uniref:beta-ketoacyl-[acyl-carrier-protein] synthase family protein n=1 Tax=Candidatus Avelusimicrobium alvi TaxID=3416221 RepID=UPI003D0EEB30